MARHNELGREGEGIAQQFLIDKGYNVIHKNWRFDKDEIDIIAMDGDTIVIVEVKTRSSDAYGHPEDAVDHNKEKYLIRATESFLEDNQLDVDSRFDVISIIHNERVTKIDHIIDAFYPE